MVTVRARPKGDEWLCEVSVDNTGKLTRHVVTVTKADLERWADGTERADVENLVARSFEFLLEREPPQAILANFKLSVIQSYFSDYDTALRRQ